jgi:phosphate transport system substrate-binding protein
VHRPRTVRRAAAIGALCAVALSACSAAPPLNPVRGAMVGIGSSGSQNAIGAWSSAWNKSDPSVSVEFSPDGATVGKQALFSGNAYFASLDAPLTSDDVSASKSACGPQGAFAVPTTVIPIAVTYNLGGIKGLKLDAQSLAGIFSGKIVRWNDQQIAAQNPDLDLPDIGIVPVHASGESVLTSVFTAYLVREAPKSWSFGTSASLPAVTGGQTVEKPSALPKEIDDHAGSITFIDDSMIDSRYARATLKFGSTFVDLSKDTVKSAVSAGTTSSSAAGVSQTLGTGGDRSYPLAAIGYQAFCYEYPVQQLAALAMSWGEFVLSPVGQDNSNTFASTASPSSEALKSSLRLIQAIEVTKNP